MTIPCGKARRLLWPDEVPRVLDAELEDARSHLEECDACQQFIADMRARRERVRALAPRPTAPPEVRERLFTALARERAALPPAPPTQSGRFRRVGRWGGATGVAVIAFLATMLVLLAPREDSPPVSPVSPASRVPIAAIAEDHIRTLHDQVIRTSAIDSVSEWLAARIPFVANVPELPGASLEGAHLCLLNGERGVVLRYRVAGRPVSYYIMPSGRGDVSPADPSTFVHEAEAGYHVVAWREAGLIHALVGDLPQDRLTELARVCLYRGAALTTKDGTSVAGVWREEALR